MQLSPMNTTDVTLKTQNEIDGCLTQTDKCATVCHVMSKSLLLIVSTKIMKIKIFYLEKKGCREIQNGLGLVLCKGVNTHWVYMKYDYKVFSRGVIRYLLGM